VETVELAVVRTDSRRKRSLEFGNLGKTSVQTSFVAEYMLLN